MNAVALNGERTLISRSAGTVRPTGIHNHPGVPTFVPHIPIGMLVVPKTDFLKLVIGERFRISTMRLGRLDRDRVKGCIADSVADIEAELYRLQREDKGLVAQFQTVITDTGVVETVSAAVACQFTREALGDEAADRLNHDLDQKARTILGDDRMGGDVAQFESLSALHRAAGSPKGSHPGHWRHRRRHFIEHFMKTEGGKGIWRAESGDWWADHSLAVDYACLLFPDFHIFTIRMVMMDPGMNAMLDSLFAIAPPGSTPSPDSGARLRLVHDADQEGGAE